MTPKLLLISGIPGTGKSRFGRWLSKKRYLHVDAENSERMKDLGLHDCFNPDRIDIPELVTRLKDKHMPIAFDWGFGPEGLKYVKELKAHGFKAAWWFTGDREAALKAFVERECERFKNLEPTIAKLELEKAIDRFYKQCEAITDNWSKGLKIEPVFRGRIIKVWKKSGKHLTKPELYDRIRRVDGPKKGKRNAKRGNGNGG